MARRTRIRYWRHLDLPGDPVFYGLLERFHREHPSIEVEFTEVPWEEEHDRLLAAFAEGNAPDCSDVVEYWWGEWIGKGLVEPLDPFIARWEGREDLIEEYWSWVRPSPDAPIHFIGGGLGCDVLWYRRDLLEAAGLEPPATVDELDRAARTLVREPGRYAIGMRGSRIGHRWWGDLLRAQGLEFPRADGSFAFEAPAAVAANQWFVDLYRTRRATPPTAITDSWREQYRQLVGGEIAMVPHTTHLGPLLREALGDRIAAVPMPAGPAGRFSTFYVQSNAIYRTSRHKEAAWEFVSWLAEAPQVDAWVRHPRRALLPTCTSLLAHPDYREDPLYRASLDSRPHWVMEPWFHEAFGRYVEHAWPTTWHRAARGDIDSAEMMRIFQSHFDGAGSRGDERG